MVRNDWSILDPKMVGLIQKLRNIVGPAVPQFGPIPQLPELAGLPKNTTILQLLIGSMMAMVAGTLFGTTFVLLGFDELVVFHGVPVPRFHPLWNLRRCHLFFGPYLASQGFRRICCKGTLANSTAGPLWTMSLATSLASSSWQLLR